MKSTLVLYTVGRIDQIEEIYKDIKEDTIFVKTNNPSSLRNATQGMRFVTIVINDLGVTLEDEEYANYLQCTRDNFDLHNKIMQVELTETDRVLVSQAEYPTESLNWVWCDVSVKGYTFQEVSPQEVTKTYGCDQTDCGWCYNQKNTSGTGQCNEQCLGVD